MCIRDRKRLGDRIELCVDDEGPGIPEFARTRVFEKFFSLERPDTGKKSTGLGLNFVKEAAALHGGTIDLNNLPERGLRARLNLPVSNCAGVQCLSSHVEAEQPG